jgi:hypothetical protein
VPVSKAHRRAQKKEAGRGGQVEKKLKSGRRVDAVTRVKATEIERWPTALRLRKSAERLRESRRRQKVLVVPDAKMADARRAMRIVGIGGTVKNLSGTRRSSVAKPRRRR